MSSVNWTRPLKFPFPSNYWTEHKWTPSTCCMILLLGNKSNERALRTREKQFRVHDKGPKKLLDFAVVLPNEIVFLLNGSIFKQKDDWTCARQNVSVSNYKNCNNSQLLLPLCISEEKIVLYGCMDTWVYLWLGWKWLSICKYIICKHLKRYTVFVVWPLIPVYYFKKTLVCFCLCVGRACGDACVYPIMDLRDHNRLDKNL